MENLNQEIFHLINQFAGQSWFFDRLMIFLAQDLVFLVPIFWIVCWFKKEKRSRKIVLHSVYAAILGILTDQLITLFYSHPRPFMLNLGTKLIPHTPGNSLPSDHTTFMLSAAFVLFADERRRKWGLILSLAGLIEGLARVFAGVHFPFDILASLLVALFVSAVIMRFKDKLSALDKLFVGFNSKK